MPINGNNVEPVNGVSGSYGKMGPTVGGGMYGMYGKNYTVKISLASLAESAKFFGAGWMGE